jgi:hypothetical protein
VVKTKALTAGFAVLVGIAGSQPAWAATLTTFSDQTTFSASTTVVTQTFGFLSSTIATGSGVGEYNILNSATNDGYVSPGDILAGLSISPTAADLVLLGPDYSSSGITNYTVFFTGLDATQGMDFTLDPGATAFSMGVLSYPGAVDATVSVYDPGSLLLGSFTVSSAPSSGVGEFFGVTTDGSDTIGSVILSPTTGSLTGVDQVQFGQATPEPGSLLMLAWGLAGLGGMVRRRNRQLAAVRSQVSSGTTPRVEFAPLGPSVRC